MVTFTQAAAPHAEHFWSIIPAGGVGSRLWPLSRAAAPKFLLDLTGSGSSLLRTTWERLMPLTPPARTVIVTGVKHRASVVSQIPELPLENLVTEPSPKESSAAIGLAAALILKRDPDAIIGSFAADHVIGEQVLFQRAVHSAITAATAGHIATIGIHPTHPATGFGYIKVGAPRSDIAPFDVYAVQKFEEKPSKEMACKYLEGGNTLWNAGMFISRADVLLEQMELNEPKLVAGLRELAAHWGTPHGGFLRETLWPDLQKIAIDYSVAEPAAAAGKMVCVAAHFSWDDLGDFASVANLLSRGRAGELAVLGGKKAQVLSEASSGIVVPQEGRLVTVVGMDDVIIVDTPDVLLVTTKEKAQDVKHLVERVRDAGAAEML